MSMARKRSYNQIWCLRLGIEGVKFVDGEKQEVETLDSEDRMSA
jgi:hypothetical protein